MTVRDLAFTVRTIQEFHVPAYMERWRMVRKMEVLDSKTIRFALLVPSPGFFNRTFFSSFIREKEWKAVVRSAREHKHEADWITNFEPKRISANGPFYLDKYVPPYFFLLKRNPHFFASHLHLADLDVGPYVDGITLSLYDSVVEALGALREGEIDFYWGDVPKGLVNRFSQVPRITLFTTYRRGYDYLIFNLDRFPFNRNAFREAIAVLVNRKAIVKEALKRNGVPAYSVIPSYNREWLNPDITEPGKGRSHRERVEEAKMLLKGAGFTWVRGKLVLPDGEEMEPVGLLTTSPHYKDYRREVSLWIKKRLFEAGIPVNLRMRSFETVRTRLRHRSFDMCLMGWGNLSDDLGYLSIFFTAARRVEREGTTGDTGAGHLTGRQTRRTRSFNP